MDDPKTGTLTQDNHNFSQYIMNVEPEDTMISDPFLDEVQVDETDLEDYDVDDIINSLDNYDDDAEALASAGWGTDEDYGCFSGGDDW